MLVVKKSEEVFSGVLFDVKRVVLEDDGQEILREIVVHPGAVAIVPLFDGGGKVLLIEQFRIAANRELYEIPAGTLEDESPESCAARELEEETGYRARTLRKVAQFYLAPGYSTELLHVFVAEGLEASKPSPEADEKIKTHLVQFDDAVEMIRKGEIVDAKTIASLLLVERFYGRR
ncbi:MAG: NUDIX hydrolase [Candidatus Caldarchaeum sp.]|nr:NUDIX hydrolase [Candidatus Caldarchaeum sp.]